MNSKLIPLPPPAAEARWWEQNAVHAQQLALLQKNPQIRKYWGNRDALDLYTAEQMEKYATDAVAAYAQQETLKMIQS